MLSNDGSFLKTVSYFLSVLMVLLLRSCNIDSTNHQSPLNTSCAHIVAAGGNKGNMSLKRPSLDMQEGNKLPAPLIRQYVHSK